MNKYKYHIPLNLIKDDVIGTKTKAWSETVFQDKARQDAHSPKNRPEIRDNYCKRN